MLVLLIYRDELPRISDRGAASETTPSLRGFPNSTGKLEVQKKPIDFTQNHESRLNKVRFSSNNTYKKKEKKRKRANNTFWQLIIAV